MKTRNYLFVFAAIVAVTFSSCTNHNASTGGREAAGPLTSVCGNSLVDTGNVKRLFTLQHNATTGYNYLGYYFTNTLVIDTSVNPYTITIQAQAARYDSVNQAWVLHNTSNSSQVCSNISVNTDTVNAVYAGPFDPVGGQFSTIKGYLHYTNLTIKDSIICPVSSIIYWNQSGSGQPVAIGYVVQGDLH